MDVYEQTLTQAPAPPTGEISPTLPHLVLVPDAQRIRLNLREIWEYRELLLFLAWRDVKVRYRQTILGAAWAILQPLVAMVIFSVVFGQLAKLPSDGIPYPIFTFTALLPWNLFATALTRATSSVVSNGNLIGKVYFPRVLVPVSSMFSAVIDFLFSFVILLAMMVWYGVVPTWRLATLPFFILLALAAALGIGLWLSALNVRYRDVSYIIPFLIQVWLYASPVAYSSTLVPPEWQWLYGLNPMVGVIEGFRWALLGTTWTPNILVLVSFVIVLVVLFTGLIYFHQMEETFADVI